MELNTGAVSSPGTGSVDLRTLWLFMYDYWSTAAACVREIIMLTGFLSAAQSTVDLLSQLACWLTTASRQPPTNRQSLGKGSIPDWNVQDRQSQGTSILQLKWWHSYIRRSPYVTPNSESKQLKAPSIWWKPFLQPETSTGIWIVKTYPLLSSTEYWYPECADRGSYPPVMYIKRRRQKVCIPKAEFTCVGGHKSWYID